MFNNKSRSKNTSRIYKGRSLMDPVADYTVLDLETTGFNPTKDRILEIGAVKYRQHKVVDELHMLLNPMDVPYLNSNISNLTHITNKMMRDGHDYQDGLRRVLDFVGNDIIVGHNVNFDINFLYDQTKLFLDHTFTNDFIDTMKWLRRVHPELDHHRLADLTELYAIINKGAHRALNDVYATQAGYVAICHEMAGTDDFEIVKPVVKTKRVARKVPPTILDQFSKSLIGSNWAITGKFDAFTRLQVINFLEQHGGIVHPNVIASTHFLLQGTFVNDQLSATAESAALYPDLIVLSEADFLRLMKDEAL